MVTCTSSFDCSSHEKSLSNDPTSITCSADTCTTDECCTVTPDRIPVNQDTGDESTGDESTAAQLAAIEAALAELEADVPIERFTNMFQDLNNGFQSMNSKIEERLNLSRGCLMILLLLILMVIFKEEIMKSRLVKALLKK